MWKQIVQPMFSASGAVLEHLETQHANHYFEIGQSLAQKALAKDDDSPVYDAVMICGGDGSMREMLMGIITHASEGSMEMSEKTRKALDRIPIAPIPLGSSNGIAESCGHKSVYSACESIITGANEGGCRFDLWKTTLENAETKKTEIVYDIHCSSTGVVAEMDYLNEYKLRWLGKLMKTLVSVVYVIATRNGLHYATLELKLHDKMKRKYTEEDKAFGYSDPKILKDSEGDWKLYPATGFLTILSCNTWSAGTDMIVCKDTKFDEGSSALQALKSDAGRLEHIKVMLGMETGTHVFQPNADSFKSSAWRIHFKDKEGNQAVEKVSVSGTIYYVTRFQGEVQKAASVLVY